VPSLDSLQRLSAARSRDHAQEKDDEQGKDQQLQHGRWLLSSVAIFATVSWHHLHSASMLSSKRCLGALAAALLFSWPLTLPAQTNFFDRWEARATATQAKQPAWAPPLTATYVGLIQVVRQDFSRPIAPNHTETWNIGGSKAVSLIPFARTEIGVFMPPYFNHSTPATKDGFGDPAFLFKYRLLAGNAQHGNYVVSAFVLGTIPTGSYKNGSSDATIAPNIGLGKGFHALDVQSTLGATLPVEDTAKLGRPIVWNTTAQLHLGGWLWPEVEANTTFFKGGPNDGRTTNYISSGLVLSRLKLRPGDPQSRLGLCAGGGVQIATSAFHTYNHSLLFTSRLLF
jgi:hypothetical protein